LKILSINTGLVQQLNQNPDAGGKQVMSAIHKHAVSSLNNPQIKRIGYSGVEGDQQANLEVHGGQDKAVYAYPQEHYPLWEELLTRAGKFNGKLQMGNFGENLTVEGFDEKNVFVGDRWRVGSLLMEIVRFREPCFKFNIKMGWSGAAKAMIQSGSTGWYLRVLEAGEAKAGDAVQVIPGERQLTILVQSTAFYSKTDQKDLWS